MTWPVRCANIGVPVAFDGSDFIPDTIHRTKVPKWSDYQSVTTLSFGFVQDSQQILASNTQIIEAL